MFQTKLCFYKLIAIGLAILLTSCISEYQETNVPVETPGTIEKLAPELPFDELTVVDWRFDPEKILILKGITTEQIVTPYDLVWLDKKNNTLIPIQVPENGASIQCPAQGKNGQVVYGRDVLYLYDSKTGKKIPIIHGCFTSFSPSGTKLAFIADNSLVIYSIRNEIIEQTIPLLPLAGESGGIETGNIGWRIDDEAVYVVYTWSSDSHSTIRSQIREIDLKTQSHQVIYEGVRIVDFSWSPDGRLIVLVETDQENHQSILKIIDKENRCEIDERIFPAYSVFVRWSPTGESILMRFTLGKNPYLIHVKNEFGTTYDQLICQ